jgi:hypothetical protein
LSEVALAQKEGDPHQTASTRWGLSLKLEAPNAVHPRSRCYRGLLWLEGLWKTDALIDLCQLITDPVGLV